MNFIKFSLGVALPLFMLTIFCCHISAEEIKRPVATGDVNETYEERFGQAEVLMKRGVALGREKKYHESVTELRKAIELIPDNGPLWYNLGMSLYNAGETAEARRAWQKTVSLRPDYADAWYMLGLLDEKSGRAADAIAAYARSSELKPGDGEAQAALIRECLRLARQKFAQLQKNDPALAQKLAGEFPGSVNPSSDPQKHPLADTEIPGTGKTFDEMLEIFKRIPFQRHQPQGQQ
ncbi:MAG: hypothetical protein ACD_39C00507G0002 [uncultured bacterium]|nr:MAG: hypothetical protein ACD_39C00507G0002 [uncultured bacterium]